MKVFLGWSGDSSHKVALALHNWLPEVIQAVKPWISSEDIAKGARWAAEIASELQSSNFGIICVTIENAKSPWINFEAGALSREIDKASVTPFLFNMKASELQGPLAQFQNTTNEETEIFRLLSDINNQQQSNSRLGETSLRKAFEMWWPRLRETLAKIETEGPRDSRSEKRTTSDMLENLLELTLGLQREMRMQVDRQTNISESLRVENAEMFRNLLATMGTMARRAELTELYGNTPVWPDDALSGQGKGRRAPWKEALASERQAMLEALERIKPKEGSSERPEEKEQE